MLQGFTHGLLPSLPIVAISFLLLQNRVPSLAVLLFAGFLIDIFSGLPFGAGTLLLITLGGAAHAMKRAAGFFQWERVWAYGSFLALLFLAHAGIVVLHSALRAFSGKEGLVSYLFFGFAQIARETMGAAIALLFGTFVIFAASRIVQRHARLEI